MIRFFSIVFLLTWAIQAQSQHKSILMTESKGVCEPSIKLDPQNPNHIVAGIVLDYVLYSTDGGASWKENKLSSPYGVWGDPVIEVDTAGNFYYFHLSNPNEGDWIDRIVCQKSEDGGKTWNEGTYTGLNGSKDQDKHWSVVDVNTNTIHLTWTEFDKYGSKDSTCYSRIRYSQSTNQGADWSPAVTISNVKGDCIDDDHTTEGAVPAIGPQGEIYVSWAGPQGIVFSKSLDNGASWTNEVVVDKMPGGWSYDIPGIYRANGLPITKCDLSNGPNRGNIYINWSDQRNGEHDTDVWLASSSDGGDTWSAATRVNQDQSTSHQFFTWMDIDQANGNLYFVYYDRRNVPEESIKTEVYMSVSNDGGKSFYDFGLEQGDDRFFSPKSSIFFGDYTNLSVHSGVIRPIWTRLDNTKLSIWCSLVDAEQLAPNLLHINVDFTLKKDAELCILLMKNGKKLRVEQKENYSKGTHTLNYIWNDTELESGAYELKVMSGKKEYWSKRWNVDEEPK